MARLEGLRILISGGAGFLGSHLVEALKGNEVIIVDNFSTVRDYTPPPWARVVRSDIESFNTSERFDIVIHMASRPSPEDYSAHPVETMLVNSIGTIRMLEIARRSDAMFLLTSTSEVYGDPEVVPIPESYWGRVNPIGPRSCYEESKRFSEAISMAYHRQYGLDVRIQRIFNTYGPRMRGDGPYGRVVSRFILQALRNEDLTIYGDGSQTRSFLYVSDWVDATLRMLSAKGLSGEVINIGSDKEVKIIDLARTIIRLTRGMSKISFLPPRPEDPRRRAADISKARKLLGWEPRVSLEEGLIKTIEWFRKVISSG